MTLDDPAIVGMSKPPGFRWPGLRWRCGWIVAHALLFAAPFVSIEEVPGRIACRR